VSAPIGIYVRVSKVGDREDERFHSPKEQVDRATALARAKGYAVGPTFEDIDVSGATAPADRPAMSQLLAAIDAGELGGIAAYSLDRLSREPGHGDALVKRVTKAGGVILTPDIPDAIDTPTGEFTFGMLLQVAKLYRSQAKARFSDATARATAAGIAIAQPPLGYRVREDRRLEIDPEMAPVVREAFERRVNGDGWTNLATFLSEATGRVWSRAGARTLIRNPLLKTGRLEYGGVVSEHYAGAIVDEALWAAAQKAEAHRPTRSKEGWLLTGIATCAGCGKNLIPWTSALNKGRRYRRYFCDKKHCQARASVSAWKLERYVTEKTFAIEHEFATRGSAPDLTALEAEVDQAKRRLDWVTTPEAVDGLGDAFGPTAKQYREAYEAALAALGEARQRAGVPELSFSLQDKWDGMTAADRRAALLLVWREIRVAARGDDGMQHVTLVGRSVGGVTEVDLPANGNGA
jgi:DNA invertase Pin-like site-specific DNA recombinase